MEALSFRVLLSETPKYPEFSIESLLLNKVGVEEYQAYRALLALLE
jgi:hypothetical protein